MPVVAARTAIRAIWTATPARGPRPERAVIVPILIVTLPPDPQDRIPRMVAAVNPEHASPARSVQRPRRNNPMTSTARAFWLVTPGHGEIRPVDLPEPGPDEVLVRTLHSGVSRG